MKDCRQAGRIRSVGRRVNRHRNREHTKGRETLKSHFCQASVHKSKRRFEAWRSLGQAFSNSESSASFQL